MGLSEQEIPVLWEGHINHPISTCQIFVDTQKEIIKKKIRFFSLAMKQSIDSDMSGGESGGKKMTSMI